MRTARGGLLPAVSLLGLLSNGAAEYTLDDCKNALRNLRVAPYNTSLPFMSAATGHFDLAVSFQSQILSILPAKVFGQFDACQTPQLYSYNAVKTQFCMLGGDKAGVCVPEQCTEKVLQSFHGDMSFITFLAMLGVNATTSTPPPCFFDPTLSPFCANAVVAKDYFEALYQNILIFARDGVSCGGGRTPADAGARHMIGFTVFLMLMCLIGTAWSAFKRKAEQCGDPSSREAPSLTPRLPAVAVNRGPVGGRPVPAVFKAFDVSDNLREIFNVRVRPGEFSCFDGLRAISAGWVIIYHVILWQVKVISNPDALLPPRGILARWWAMPLFNFSGTLCVDTFLFISAFLAVFLLLKKLEKEKRPVHKWAPLFYINRFLRITPAYMYALFFNWKLAPLFTDGPLAKTYWANDHKNCPDQWWRHLLYINTISPWDTPKRLPQCFGHTWYLADDMIFFYTVAPLALLYRWRGNTGKALATMAVVGLIIGCMATNAVMAYRHHWSPNTWDGEPASRFQREAFEVPWSRAPSYFIGMLTAFLWYEKKRIAPKFKFPWWLVTTMVVFAAFFGLAIQYGPITGSEGIQACIIARDRCGSGWPTIIKVVLAFAARPAWAIGIALMCLLCFNGQGWWVNSFLSAPIWAPFSFLSYTVYLVHYTILTTYTVTQTMRIRWDFFEFIVLYLGLTALSHILATFVALLVEKPAMKLQKHFIDPSPPKKDKPAKQAAGDEPAQAPPTDPAPALSTVPSRTVELVPHLAAAPSSSVNQP